MSENPTSENPLEYGENAIRNGMSIASEPTPESAFARMVIDRGFRLAEVAALLKLDRAEVTARLENPEVQRHLERMVSTGEASVRIMGPTEIMERLTRLGRVNIEGMDPKDAVAWGRLGMDAALAVAKLGREARDFARMKKQKGRLSKMQALEVVRGKVFDVEGKQA